MKELLGEFFISDNNDKIGHKFPFIKFYGVEVAAVNCVALNRVRFYCPITDAMPRLIECQTVSCLPDSLFFVLYPNKDVTHGKKEGKKF